MFKRSTTLILGAAASFELGLPLGSTLLKSIADKLNINFQYGRDQISGSNEIWYALAQIAQRTNQNPNTLRAVALRIREAAQTARSIDNVIHINNDDQFVAVVAKLAICQCILEAERKSRLRINREDPFALNWTELGETWVYWFTQMLTTDAQKSDIERIFDNLTIITFNYDRTIERLMPLLLVQTYGILPKEAEEIVQNKLRIYHPYGQVGSLDYWKQTPVTVPFGQVEIMSLEQVSQGILTFTEQVTDRHSDLPGIRKAVQEAEQIIFLGFGYHNQNMTLLQPELDCRADYVLGTVYEEPAAAIQPITKAIKHMLSQTEDHRTQPELVGYPCWQFMKEYYRPITS